jgi:DNA-binding winged helix-turn-helix (wHTH) protein
VTPSDSAPEPSVRILGSGLSVQPAPGCLTRDDGTEVHLRPKTFQLLLYLVRSRARIVSTDELVLAVWRDTAVTDDAVPHRILELRRVLGDEAKQPRVRTELYLRATNVLNTVNKSGFSGVMTSPLFGLPRSAQAARRAELGMRVRF